MRTLAIFRVELDCHAEAEEDVAEGALERPCEVPKATKPCPIKPARRPRKDPRLKSTRELSGLFDKKPEDKDEGSAPT